MSNLRSGKDMICKICGKEFYVTPSRLKKNKSHTCSVKCSGKFNSIRYSKKVERECVICSKKLYYKPSRSAKVKNPTCSKKCSTKLRSQLYSGSGNPKSKLTPK